MAKKTYTIGILSLLAALLLIGNLLPLPAAEAAFAVKDTRYHLIATRSIKGGESLYVIDNSTGQIAVMAFENGSIRPITVEPLTMLFK